MSFKTKLTTTILILILGGFVINFIYDDYGPSFSYGEGDFYFKKLDSGVCNLKIDGSLRVALEEKFNEGLKKLENCSSYNLALNSGGGSLGTALRLGEIVKDKKMNTIILDKCKSGCMYIFIAGKNRVVSKYSVLGLHQGADIDTKECIDPKVNTKDNRDFFSRMKSYTNDMLGAKVGGFFRSKDNLATCNEMLVLDNEELYKKGVITKLLNED